MQDINNDNSFDKKELSVDENKIESKSQEIGTAYKNLDKSRKIAVIFLAFFSVFLFIAWGFTTKNRINSPFENKTDSNVTPLEDQSSEDLSNIDTDRDGLLDWEEENLYNTSPYLEDSDSDGILDGEEINQGTDPNCPEGEDCSVTDSLEDENNTIQTGLEDLLPEDIDLGINVNENLGISEDGLSEALQGGSDAPTLRKMLLDAGMDKGLLDSITDEDLISSYNEILQ